MKAPLQPSFARWMQATMGRIIAERRKRGMSQEVLSMLSGISQRRVSAIESARNTAPTLENLYRITQAMQLEIAVVPRASARSMEQGKRMNVFVFGSNTAGRHGKGAALYAKQNHGAIYGQGEGLQGASYAIPTKDDNLHPLPVEQIAQAVQRFKEFAARHPEMLFEVTPIGCGLAGYAPADIAPLFAGCPDNCVLPGAFTAFLQED
ncbi:MAG: A1S_2505 family phage non-structural protein [Telluria sp.]